MNEQPLKTCFKSCPHCKVIWKTRDDFLADPSVKTIGYQANFVDLEQGLFVFLHELPECRTSLALDVSEFSDLHDGPIFQDRLIGTDACGGHCLHDSDLAPCNAKCECAYVRDVLQKIKNWEKRSNVA